MNKLVGVAALVTALGVGTIGHARAHGGSYGGPGDVVPPGGGGSGGGGGSTPGTGGPNTPGPNAPSTPGPRGPGTPTGGAGGAGGPSTGGGGIDTSLDLTRWQFWWELNKEPYLDLKRHLYEERVATGADEIFMNPSHKAAHDVFRPARERIRADVVPALLAALDHEQANDVLTGALIALAKIGDERDESGRSPFARRIATFLVHPNQEVAETAAVALGILGDEGEAGLLAALLGDDRAGLAQLGVKFDSPVPDRTRAFAAYALGLLGEHASLAVSQRICTALAAPLADGGRSFAKRDVPVACALAFGLVALPSASSEGAAATGPFRAREQQIAWLLERFADRRSPALIRAQMPRSLARLAAELDGTDSARTKVVETLLASLEGKPAEDVYVQESCVLALGMLGDCDADALDVRVRSALIRAHSESKDQQAQRFALIALAQVAGRAGHGEGDPLAGLSVKKDDPRAFLLERLRKGQSNERCWAALALGVLERALDDQRLPTSADARTALRFALSEASAADEVGACAIALGIARERAAREALLDKFAHVGDPDARGYVALALGMLGDESAIEPIQRVLAQAKYQADLLRSAATALGLLGDRQAVPGLVEMLSNANALSSQAAIASALGTIGDARSIEPLVGMLHDTARTATARGFAAAALGIVADKDAHPWVARISLGLNYRASTETLTAPDGGTGILQIL